MINIQLLLNPQGSPSEYCCGILLDVKGKIIVCHSSKLKSFLINSLQVKTKVHVFHLGYLPYPTQSANWFMCIIFIQSLIDTSVILFQMWKQLWRWLVTYPKDGW